MSKATLRTFIVEIKQGKPAFTSEYQRSLFNQFLSQFEGKKVWLTIDPKIPVRSLRQNRYLWLFYQVIADETGHTAEEVHEFAKEHCLPVKEIEMFGKKTKIHKTTTTLTKGDTFPEFIKRLEVETGIPAPDTTPYHLEAGAEEDKEAVEELYKNLEIPEEEVKF